MRQILQGARFWFSFLYEFLFEKRALIMAYSEIPGDALRVLNTNFERLL